MQCPVCKLVNPPTAGRCDCGYAFGRSGDPQTPVTTACGYAQERQAQRIITLLMIILVIVAISQPLHFCSTPGRWEYLIVAFKDDELETGLRNLGNEGWEVSSGRRAISRAGSGESEGLYELILKRRKSPF